ncbi:MAG: ABC transporter permease subunit/CPBP intramembrane protease [Planctomycetota bacterium]
MRWSIIRLIWLRELRDQLRDRRTVFMIVGLPLVLYPALGIIVLTFALQFFEKPSLIGVVVPNVDLKRFPARDAAHGEISPAGAASLIANLADAEPTLWAAILVRGHSADAHYTYPALIEDARWGGPTAVTTRRDAAIIGKRFKIVWLAEDDTTALADRRVGLALQAKKSFYKFLETEEHGIDIAPVTHPPRTGDGALRPTITVQLRPDDDHSRQALMRIRPLLDRWKGELKKVRFVRRGIDAAFDDPFELDEPKHSESNDPEKIMDMIIRIFPFMLVMWSLAGALYPAVDLCAGEKERGTMETLLISPAGREEIVIGKFLTIWMFSSASALLNLLSMGLTTWQFSAMLPRGTFPLGAVFWCIVLSLPLSALFSAISLAIGAYARSSKEGQYYLMPLFLVTMPLVFLTLAPGVELNPVYALIPVTGVALLMQKLMTSPSLATVPWLYFIPVLVPIALYSALALRWAIDQFHREEVLFREAERLDIGLWFRRLLRDKDLTATTGQAFFCFALLMFLKWLSFGIGARLGPLVQSSIVMLAFVATPALMMAVMLNIRPLDTLNLHRPRAVHLGLAAVLGLLIAPPIIWGTHTALTDHPQLEKLLDSPQSFARDQAVWRTGADNLFASLLVFAVLPALAEELAFRGFILTGLRKRYRMRTSTFLCSFMNALFHMNVFAFVPVFAVSLVLGLLTLRSKSVVPAMLLHFFTKAALLLSGPILLWFSREFHADWAGILPVMGTICSVAVLALCAWLYIRKLPEA